MIISLCGNLFLTIQLRSLKSNVSSSNLVISTRVESYIRATMLSIKALAETGAKEEMIELQRSVQQLVSTFNNWIDLNQTEDNVNEPLMRGLTGLESLRNIVVHHLNNQYSSRSEQLTDYDIVVLDKIYEQLDRFLIVYNNIQGRAVEIKNPSNSDGGLGQWASNMEEISRLYRHSRIPNEHPKYIGLGSILTSTNIMFPEINSLVESKIVTEKIKEDVQIQDGVHYYEIGYYTEGELLYSVWVDAIDGSLRQFEDYTTEDNNGFFSKDEALNIAKKFMNRFSSYEQVIDGVSSIIDENTKNTIYAFQFIPDLGDITVISDRIKVSVSSRGGKLLKYSSSFSNTMVPNIEAMVTLEDIEEKYSEQLVDMQYKGMSIVRSFYTHYRPVITYNYQAIKKEETRKLYFDLVTGNQVYESYSVYEPVAYITAEDSY